MEKTTNVVRYIRKNRPTEAVIYVRGNNEEFQETMCRLYAVDKGYKVLYTTRNIEDVNLCDVLLIANSTRISRDKFKYYETVKRLKKKGIKVECAVDTDEAGEYITLLMREMFNEKMK